MKISEIYEARSGMPKAPRPNMNPMPINNLVAKHSNQKGGTHKPAKGKGSYDRKSKHTNKNTDAY